MKAACGSMRDGKIPSHLRLLLPVANKSRSRIMRARKLALPPHQLHYTGEQTLYNALAANRDYPIVCGEGCTQVSQPLGNENWRTDLVLTLHKSPSAI